MRAPSVLVALAVLAGCLTAPAPVPTAPSETASQALASLAEIVPFETASQDGTMLRGHVYLPKGDGPFAVILELSPYWNFASYYGDSDGHATEVDGRATMDNWLRPYLDAGFAVALVNLRGTGLSDGCLQWGSPLDVQDAYAVVEGLAAEPWSSGNVGMSGLSYPGWTQYMALAARPPHLKALLPASGVIDLHSLFTRNGQPILGAQIFQPFFTAETFGLGSRSKEPQTNHAPCPEHGPEAIEWQATAWNGDRTDYWKARDLRPLLANATVPVFFTNGMTDGEGHILQFEGLWDLLAGEKRMMVGQWPHGYPEEEVPDFWDLAVAWFDHHLRGGPPVPSGFVDYQDQDGAWHRATSWPPPATQERLWLSTRAFTYRALVEHPSQVSAGNALLASTDADPSMEGCVPGSWLVADDPLVQVLFASPALAEEVLLAGNFEVELTLSANAPDGNLAVFLFDSPAGSCPDRDAREIRRALTDLRHAAPGAEGKDFPLHEPTTVVVRSHPFAHRVPAGHHLVLAVSGGSLELLPDARKPTLTIHVGDGAAGSVTLPVVEGELRFGPQPAPAAAPPLQSWFG